MISLIDTQVIMPKSLEISQISENQSKEPQVQQEAFAQHLAKQIDEQQHSVTDTEKSSEQKLDKDGSNENKERRRNSKNNRKHSTDKADSEKKRRSNNMFDVTI